MQRHAIKNHKQILINIREIERVRGIIKPRTAQILNKNLINQKLDKHILASGFSLHFLSKEDG